MAPRSCDGAGVPGGVPERGREPRGERRRDQRPQRLPGPRRRHRHEHAGHRPGGARGGGPGRARRRRGGVAHAASFGALMGARGNSGVITSQILAGIAEALAGKRRFNGLDLAHALDTGSKKAYKAVAKPVEGTILTVIREAAAAAVEEAERDNDLEAVLAATVDAAERSVAKTPSLLPILREAHVVDSGGQGLFRLFQGALAAARGRALEAEPAVHGAGDAAARRRTDGASPGSDETAYGYETVYLLRPRRGRGLDVPAIQAHLESIGDSVLVAGRRAHGQDPRPQRPARRRHRLRPRPRDAVADHGREPRRPGARRPRGEGEGVHRRGQRDARAGRRGARRSGRPAATSTPWTSPRPTRCPRCGCRSASSRSRRRRASRPS